MENIIWLEENKDHYLYELWRSLYDYGEQFATTCCHITCERLAEKFSGKKLRDWESSEVFDKTKSFYVIQILKYIGKPMHFIGA